MAQQQSASRYELYKSSSTRFVNWIAKAAVACGWQREEDYDAQDEPRSAAASFRVSGIFK